MKISGLEKGILALTAAFLLLTAGYFLGQRGGAEPYTVSAQTLWAEEETLARTQEETETETEPTARTEAEAEPEMETGSETEPAAETAAEPESGAGLVNINTAGASELETLPGIGQARAEAIIADREANGPFRIPEDITRVSGIGQGILAQILDYITVE